jgi:drug/metabolite transporter (DMT)-like permease
MLASFLTTIFFSLSVIFASRSSRILGGTMANLGRISIAAVLLAIWAHGFGAGIDGPALPWFFLSGVIGFGLGDMALFGALPRIGPRLSILLTQCLAAPIAAVTEWFWLGTALHPTEMLWAAVILGGVGFALAPDHGWEGSRRVFWVGVLFGVGSAIGQALGAVVSRKANLVAEAANFPIDGGSAAYQRIIGGLLMTIIGFAVLNRFQGSGAQSSEPMLSRWRRGWPLVVANAFAGPAIGVGCYQIALKGTPSGIVLPIVAASPLVTMILSYFIEGLRPKRRAVFGGVIAVLGAVALARARA